MFTISNSKTEITVEHTHSLAKTSILPADTLVCVAEIDLDMDLKSSAGKDIIGKFDTIFNKKISPGMKKQHDRIDKTRDRLEKMIHDVEPETKIKQYADTQQEDIIRDWNQFARNDLKRMAINAVDDAIKALGKKTSVVFKDLKIGFSSNDIKDSQHAFLTGILGRPEDADIGRVQTGGMVGLVQGLTKLAENSAGVQQVLEGNLKLLKQAAADTTAVKTSLAALEKAAHGLEGKLERVKKIEAATSAKSNQIATMAQRTELALEAAHKTALLNKAERVARMMQAAKSEIGESVRKAKSVGRAADNDDGIAKAMADLSKNLQHVNDLIQKKTETVIATARLTGGAMNDTKNGTKQIVEALKELKLQSMSD